MFDWFRRTPTDPPTAKQIAYAEKLGISVSKRISKSDLSAAISRAENADPKLLNRRNAYEARMQSNAEAEFEAAYTPEVRQAEEYWNRLAVSNAFVLAVYSKGAVTIVDVLMVCDTELFGRNVHKLKICFSAPKLIKDKHIGDYLDWDRDLAIPLEKLLYRERLPDGFDSLEMQHYQSAVERGLEIARTLK